MTRSHSSIRSRTTIAKTAQAGTPISCKLAHSGSCRIGSGGQFNPTSNPVEYQVAFKNSLRKYEPIHHPAVSFQQKTKKMIKSKQLSLSTNFRSFSKPDRYAGASPNREGAEQERTDHNLTSPLAESAEFASSRKHYNPFRHDYPSLIESMDSKIEAYEPRRGRNKSLAIDQIDELQQMSQTCANKFVIDNPKFEHQVNLKNYQRYLDLKLSKPKLSPRESPSPTD